MGTRVVPFVPVLVVVASACVVMVAGWFRRGRERVHARLLAAIGLVASLGASVMLWDREAVPPGVLVIDNYTIFFNILLCAFGLVTVLAPQRTSRPPRTSGAGGAVLFLLTMAGMMLVAAARDMVLLCLTLATAWLGSVALVGTGHRSEAATEAALKILICGAISAAFLFYGAALTYALTGATRFNELATRVAASSLDPNVLVLLAIALLLVGLAFTVSAVPCHAWTPDVCSGADAPLAGFVAAGLKTVGFAAALRVLLTPFETLRIEWLPVVSAMAGLTMVAGAVAAAGQPGIRRLLAYAGVAHGGYLLMGLAAASPMGKASVLFSLAVWAAANVAIFSALPLVTRAGRSHTDVGDLAGLGRQQPGLAALLTVGLLSLAGLPPSGGFVARWVVFGAALQEGLVALVALGALTSVLLAFVCVRPVVQMYLTPAPAVPDRPPVSLRALAGQAAVAVLLIHAGVWPGWWLEIAERSVASLF